jgi:hypothetical protein
MGFITLQVLAKCFFLKEIVQAMEKKLARFFRVANKEGDVLSVRSQKCWKVGLLSAGM